MRRLAFFMVVLAGCGNDLTSDQACTALANDSCAALMKCSPSDLQRRWPDIATCEAREKLACTDALKAPKTANSPSHEDSCGAALSTQACPQFLSGVSPPVACIAPKGTGADGSPCAFAAQCSSGFCAVPPNTLCGTCAALPNPGDSCANQGCGQNMNCVGATPTCQVPVADGGACSRDQPCIEGDACVGATMTAMGTCHAQATAVGAACDARLMTMANCNPADGLTCDSATSTCVTEMLAGVGQQCGLVGTVLVGCSSGASCVRPSGSQTGTCVAPAADGAACDTAAGPFCTFPAKCVTTGGTAGTCELAGSMNCG